MNKQIGDMTAAELGRLFPIILSDHDDAWKEVFRRERAAVEGALGEDVRGVEHIGSTAIPGIKAKPTIDLLVEIRTEADTAGVIRRMREAGYQYSPQPENPAPHMMFMKGYTPEGFQGQAVHVHVRYPGDWDEIYFRDYLRVHAEAAAEYERLKMELQKKHRYNREDYTNGKTDFVKRISRMAREEKGTAGRELPASMPCRSGDDAARGSA
jgi:GrpB-like predicted nucleotidyltransferase (UPF0157 family)